MKVEIKKLGIGTFDGLGQTPHKYFCEKDTTEKHARRMANVVVEASTVPQAFQIRSQEADMGVCSVWLTAPRLLSSQPPTLHLHTVPYSQRRKRPHPGPHHAQGVRQALYPRPPAHDFWARRSSAPPSPHASTLLPPHPHTQPCPSTSGSGLHQGASPPATGLHGKACRGSKCVCCWGCIWATAP